MQVNVIPVPEMTTLEPLSVNRPLHKIPIAGITLEERLVWMFELEAGSIHRYKLDIRADLWPSKQLIERIIESPSSLRVIASDGTEMAKLSRNDDTEYQEIPLDEESLIIRYPWDLLAINEIVVDAISKDHIKGIIRENVSVDGVICLGKGSILLPGVYIEGKVVIGENCKIGPNCYIRGNTYIGDNCHVGQAVEIKNSMLMHNVSAGHLSYVGDSIIGAHTNLGAGTIGANLKHDNKSQKTVINRKAVDTGRRKLGFFIGDNVHTGIHTSIYPGRKLWPNTTTKPGEIVSRDKEE